MRGKHFLDCLDPVADRQPGGGLQMGLTADVGGKDCLRFAGTERADLVGEEPSRDFRLQDGIRAGGTAAQVRIGNSGQLEAEVREQCLDFSFELQPVLEGEGG